MPNNRSVVTIGRETGIRELGDVGSGTTPEILRKGIPEALSCELASGSLRRTSEVADQNNPVAAFDVAHGGYFRVTITSAGCVTSTGLVNLIPGSKQSYRVNLARYMSIRGRLLDCKDRPIAGALILAAEKVEYPLDQESAIGEFAPTPRRVVAFARARNDENNPIAIVQASSRTDERGCFDIEMMEPRELAVCARIDNINIVTIVDSAPSPINGVLYYELRGREPATPRVLMSVVDSDGTPMRNTSLWILVESGSAQSDFRLPTDVVTSDQDGIVDVSWLSPGIELLAEFRDQGGISNRFTISHGGSISLRRRYLQGNK